MYVIWELVYYCVQYSDLRLILIPLIANYRLAGLLITMQPGRAGPRWTGDQNKSEAGKYKMFNICAVSWISDILLYGTTVKSILKLDYLSTQVFKDEV